MSILNRPTDGLLSVLIALRRAILVYGPLPVDRLLALCAPKTIVGLNPKPYQGRQTLHRWTQLGLFIESDGVVRVAPSAATVGLDDVDGLRALMLEVVLSERNNPQLRLDALEHGDDPSLAGDFTRALCWTLAQDVYVFEPTHLGVEALQAAQRVKPTPFVNDTRWQGFVEWAGFLGFMWSTPRPMINPAAAIRWVLPSLFGAQPTLTQDQFLGRLAARLPVLDGGSYRELVERSIGAAPRTPKENDLSISLSAALLQLEASGALRLEARSDAPTRTMTGRRGIELRSFSHVTRIEVT